MSSVGRGEGERSSSSPLGSFSYLQRGVLLLPRYLLPLLPLLFLGWSYCSWHGAIDPLLGSPGSRCSGEESPKAGPAAEPKKLMTQMTSLLSKVCFWGGQRDGSSFQSAKTDGVTKSNSSVSGPIAPCLWSRASTSTRCLSLGRCKLISPTIYIFKHHYNTSSLILSWL